MVVLLTTLKLQDEIEVYRTNSNFALSSTIFIPFPVSLRSLFLPLERPDPRTRRASTARILNQRVYHCRENRLPAVTYERTIVNGTIIATAVYMFQPAALSDRGCVTKGDGSPANKRIPLVQQDHRTRYPALVAFYLPPKCKIFS